MAAETTSDIFLDVLENGAVSVHVVDADGIIIWANREELNTLGYSPEKYIGKHIANFHCDRVVIEDILTRLGRFETIRNYPAKLKHADGSTIHVEITSSVHRDKDGYFQHTRCFTTNVTSRVLMEADREMNRVKLEVIKERMLAKKREQHAAELTRVTLRLEHEQRLRQNLLNRMLPPMVSSTLLQGKAIEPQLFSHVTVFFSDIVGFTDIASHVKPREICAFLNKLYTVMDECAANVGVYKIETIGDAYMAVGGLQDPNQNHWEAIADFSLLVQEAVDIVKNPLSREPVKLRIGLHSGPVVAGIVGNLMPRYCLFGDTVNVASRMESTGEAGRIHCSDHFAKNLAHMAYHLTPRGEIPVKGKGTMTTWWLDSVSKTKAALLCRSKAAIQSRAASYQAASNEFCLEAFLQDATMHRQSSTFQDISFASRCLSDEMEHLDGAVTKKQSNDSFGISSTSRFPTDEMKPPGDTFATQGFDSFVAVSEDEDWPSGLTVNCSAREDVFCECEDARHRRERSRITLHLNERLQAKIENSSFRRGLTEETMETATPHGALDELQSASEDEKVPPATCSQLAGASGNALPRLLGSTAAQESALNVCEHKFDRPAEREQQHP
eukprot:TRINITY_DN6182_c0_g2_i2.p1 TRINITY_DN6182_c0_g2~~TRINITY_DN6182_c0_g2_i2.p1  ORF type:complete len:613 (-),score=112.54 TRINITY_DN6182_c0_g2_i2:30-1868(-)